MADMTEEQIAKQKAAIDSMGRARAHMSIALDRVADLERGLENAIRALTKTKEYVGVGAYTYTSSPQVSAHDWIDAQIAEARRKLG